MVSGVSFDNLRWWLEITWNVTQMAKYFFFCENTTQQKQPTCPGLMKTGLNNVLLPRLFDIANNTVQHCWAWTSLQSSLTTLNNIVNNLEQCWQQNIVQSCFHQARTGCSFFAVYCEQTWTIVITKHDVYAPKRHVNKHKASNSDTGWKRCSHFIGGFLYFQAGMERGWHGVCKMVGWYLLSCWDCESYF